MEQITIELPKSVSNELDTYAREHQISSSAIAQKAIEEFLLGQGYLSKPLKPFRLTPATQGSGYTDTSINRDAVLAEYTLLRKSHPQ